MRYCARHFALLLLVGFCSLFGPSLAAVDLTPTEITVAGVADTVTAANAGGNTFTNTGVEYVEVINASASTITVTIDAFPSGGQGSPGGLTVTDPTVSILASTRKRFGPFPRAAYNNGTNKVTVTYSAVTTVTVGVYRLTSAP